MKQHKSEEQIEELDLLRKKVNSELLCLKEKTKEELNLWSGLTTKFVMIKAFSDHLSNTVELIEKQSLEAERSKSLLEGTMSEQLIFLSKATLQISDFSTDLSYSEHERALCALHHGKLKDELKDLEKCLTQAVSEATNMANYKEMIEGQLIAAKETYDRDEAMLLQIQESLLSDTKEAEHQLQAERPISERSSTTVEKLSFQVAELQAIRMSLQSQVQEHTSYATYLEHCFACRQEVTEDKLDALQAVLQATQRKAVEASLQIQNLNQVISSLKEQDDESAAVVAKLKQQLDEAQETLHKQIEEMALQKTVEAIEVQNLNELIRTLQEQNDESSVLVADLRQEVAEAKETLNEQMEKSAQQKAGDAVEAQNLIELIRTLKEQNEESSVLVADLRQEVAEAKETLNEQMEKSAQQKAGDAVEAQNLIELIRTLKEQNEESSVLVADLRQEVAEAKETLNEQMEKSAQQKAGDAVEAQNLIELIRTLKEQNEESSVLVADLRQEVAEAKETLNEQMEKSAQQKAGDAVEAQNLIELIRTLKEQNEESSVLVADLRQEVAEAKETLNEQMEKSAQQKAGDAVEAQNLIELIRTLKEQNEESSVLVADLRQEVAEAKETLNEQMEKSAQQKAGDAVEAQNLIELIRTLKEQNEESSVLVADLRQEVAEAKETLNKHSEETAQRKAKDSLEIQNLYEVIKTLKDQNNESAALVVNLRQEVDEAKDTLKMEIEGLMQRKAVDTLEIQNLDAVVRTLKEQNAENSALVASLRQEVAEAKDTLNKKVGEMAQRQAADAVEAQNLNGVIRALEEQNDESSALVSRLRQEFAEAKHTLNKQDEEMAQRKALEAVEVHNLNEVIKTLKEQNDKSTALVVHLRQEVAEAKHTLNKQVEDRAQRKALETGEVQNLSEMIMTLKEQNHESVALVANLRQEVAEAKGTLNKQAEEMAHQRAREATEIKNLIEVIKTLTEQNDQSSAIVVSLRHEVAEAKDTLNKQIEETAQKKAVETGEVLHLNEVIRALKKENDESAAVVANLRQEVAEAKDTLNKQIQESAQQKAGDAVEAQNLNEVIKVLKEQKDESVALVANLRQEVAEAKDTLNKQGEETAQRKAKNAVEIQNLKEVVKTLKEQNDGSTAVVAKLTQEVAKTMKEITNHPDETETELCRSLVDHAHQVFEDFSDFKSWYASDVLEDLSQQGSDLNIVENNPLRDLIISFRGQDLPNLKSLGEHLKHAKVASVSAYNKLIGNCLQEKQNLKDEILNLQKKNEQLCHQMATAEKNVVDLKIRSESDLRAQEDALTRHLEEIPQRNEQKIFEMRRQYELNRKEVVPSETPKAQQETQFIKVHLNSFLEDMRNATSNYTPQNVVNTGMSRQTLRHVSDNCMEGSALNGLQSTQKETKTKGSNEPQLKRLKSSQVTNSAGGDGIDVVATKKKERRKFSVKAADTSNGRQTFDRRCKDKNCMVEEQHLKPERLPVSKRTRGSNINSISASQQSGAKSLPSSGLGDLFDDSVMDPYEDQMADPYAFV